MTHITNAADVAQTFEGYSVPPGYCVLPGPVRVVYLPLVGEPEILEPAYLESFGMGILLALPFCSVLVARRIASLVKPQVLDRFI